MPSGRIPKPKVIADLHGNRHRKDMTEPTPPKGMPVCPDHLDTIAKDEWQSVTTQLDRMGLLSSADERSLELYCAAYSRYRHAEEKVRQFGEVIISPATKYPMVSPYSIVMQRNLDTCKKMLDSFGLNPAARVKCAVPTKAISDAKWRGVLKVAS